jgi:RimJ/RimL family protein N-acetyltransferase
MSKALLLPAFQMLYNFNMENSSLTFHPLTPDRWQDFESLFGANGACAGCWCMFWRLSRKDWTKAQYEPNRLAMKAIVDSGEIPGIIAYRGQIPVGWVSVAPRERFPSLQRSDVLAPIDDQPVWSIVCFYIPRKMRKQGIMHGLVQAALDHAHKKGAHIVEVYPFDSDKPLATLSAYMGIKSVLEKAGFKEVIRRSPGHPILRIFIS